MCDKCDALKNANARIEVSEMVDESEALTYMVTRVESDLHEEGWDQSGRVFVVSIHEGLGLQIEEHSPFNNTIGQNPPEVLRVVVEALSGDTPTAQEGRLALGKVLPENFYGLLLVVEAWGVHEPTDKDSHEWREVQNARQARELHKHPDRRELRMALFSSIDGRLVHTARYRDMEPVPAREESGVLDGTSVQYMGQVPRNLARFVQICADVAPSCSVL